MVSINQTQLINFSRNYGFIKRYRTIIIIIKLQLWFAEPYFIVPANYGYNNHNYG